jgi:hypothetical protein
MYYTPMFSCEDPNSMPYFQPAVMAQPFQPQMQPQQQQFSRQGGGGGGRNAGGAFLARHPPPPQAPSTRPVEARSEYKRD